MIPVNEPLLTDVEAANVSECISSGWISSAGSYIDAFEKEWAAYCNRKEGISISNGTVALEAAVACLDLEPGSQIVMPTFTIISCAMAAVFNGMEPVLVDSDPETWCMDVQQLEDKITPRTKAVMPVHMYGHPVDMDPLLKVAERHGLKVIEDAAEAHGAEYRGRRCGSFGDVSSFSFYANKIVTTGEGGMVLTDSPHLATRLRSYRNLHFRPERRFYHTELGHNFRFTNLQAAVGIGQVRRMTSLVEAKRKMAARYTRELSELAGIELPVERDWATNVYWMYGLVLKESVPLDAVEFAKKLAAKGVETRPFFLGMHEQPALRERGLFAGEQYPVADRLARRGLYLPSGLALTEDQQTEVIASVKSILGNL